MIDGTFMKGKHRGVLLSAVGKDRNEGKISCQFCCVFMFFVVEHALSILDFFLIIIYGVHLNGYCCVLLNYV